MVSFRGKQTHFVPSISVETLIREFEMPLEFSVYLIWPSRPDRSVILVISIILAEEQNEIKVALLHEIDYCMSPDMNRFISSSVRLLFDPNDPYCGNDGNKAPYQSSRRSRLGIGLPSKEINWCTRYQNLSILVEPKV